MNVRKRGLALLMCICMIFTLLPFSAFADGTSKPDVVYGTYDNGQWKQDANATDTVTRKTEGDNTLSLTKTAKKTADNTYEITLKVVSTQTETTQKPGSAATVLVMDVSGSMASCANCGKETHDKNDKHAFKSRIAAAKDAAYEFILSYSGAVLKNDQVTGLKVNAKDGLGRYVSVVSFSTGSSVACEWMDVSTVAGYNAVKAAIDGLKADGGTNLDAGLQTANAQFNDEAVKDITAKNVIALTDGMPTFYVGGDDKNGNHGSYGCPDTNAATANSATELKKSASVYTVCFGASEDKCWEKDSEHNWKQKKVPILGWIWVASEWHETAGPTVGDFLRDNIATQATYAYNADNTTELMKVFKAITSSITEGIKTGTVLDPMGDHITVTSNLANFVETDKGYKWELGEPDSKVTQNGKTTYTYELTYTVTFDPNFEGFDEDSYYAANKETTFTPAGSTNSYNFNVPGVKGTAPEYKVTYKFEGTCPDSVAVPASEQHKAGDTVTMPEITAPEGWIFNGWKYNGNAVTSVEMPAGDITIVGTFTEQKAYTVKYLLNGTDISVKDADTGTENVGESVEATAPDLAGYTFAGTDAEKNQTITVVSDASKNVITFYYYKNVTVTANDDTKVYGDNNPAAFGATVTGTRDNETVVYTVGRQAGEDVGNYAITPTGNEIQGYYKVEYKNGSFTIIARPVTLTGESDTRTYTGQEIELTDIKQSGLLDGHELSGVSYSAKGTDPGEYNGVFTGNVVIKDAQDNDVTANYSVTKTPGKLTINPAYQITYQYSNTPENAPACPVDDTYYADGTTVSPLKNPGTLEGYIFSGWKINGEGDAVNSVTFDDANITLIGEWKPVEGLTCTINYWWMGDSEKPMKTKTVDNLTFGQPYSASPETFDGYTVENGDEQTITIKTTGNVINFYYYKNVVLTANSDRATYDGNTHQVKTFKAIVAADRNADIAAQLGNYISALGEGKNADEYDVLFYRGKEVIPVTDLIGRPLADIYYVTDANTGTLTITPRSVTITSGSASKTYDGTPLTNDEITITGDGFVDGEATAIATGSQTDVGHSDNTIEIIKKDGFDANNYAIELKEGTLTVEKRPYRPNPPITDKITVEITGNSDSVVYDGAEHSVKDYTVKISDSRYTEKDFTFSGKALASGVNAGAYEMGLKADQFKNTNARFTNVEFIIKADGVLTITQRPLTITAGSAEGIAPVTCDKYTVEGLATGDKVDSVKITGIQSEPGESPNVASDAVIKNAKGEDVTANYKITYVDGVLKAIEVLNKEIHFNYVIGYTDGTIRPNNDISRAEVATIFFRLLTDEARTQYDKTTSSFSDIKDGAWCCRAVSTLTNMGIIKGYTDGSFQPNKSITRAELATIIARFAKLDVNTKTFSDINGHWAQKNIELAAGNGWINGYEDGTFRPNNNITRAETFAMINRVLDRQTESVSDLLPTSEMNMWSDNLNENAWYYKDVQEATNYHKCDRVGDSVYEKWTEKVPDIDWASYQI